MLNTRIAVLSVIFLCSCGTGGISIPTPPSATPSTLTFDATTNQTQTVTMNDPIAAPYTTSGCSGIVTATASGNTITVTAVGGGTCDLTIDDSRNRGATVGISVTTVSLPAQ